MSRVDCALQGLRYNLQQETETRQGQRGVRGRAVPQAEETHQKWGLGRQRSEDERKEPAASQEWCWCVISAVFLVTKNDRRTMTFMARSITLAALTLGATTFDSIFTCEQFPLISSKFPI